MAEQARELGWLVNSFAERTPGVTHATVVSSDGLLISRSDRLPQDGADQLAALSSSLASIAEGAARMFEGDGVRQTIVEMGRGYCIVAPIRDGSLLSVLAVQDCDTRVVSYEMSRLVEQAGELLTPAVRAKLQDAARYGYHS
ncbi:MAG: roadblock/LC7 domain-containing protein [Micromonosporaceae bacterium]